MVLPGLQVGGGGAPESRLLTRLIHPLGTPFPAWYIQIRPIRP
jgi:hypothetical protein